MTLSIVGITDVTSALTGRTNCCLFSFSAQVYSHEVGSHIKAIRQDGCLHRHLVCVEFTGKACFFVHGAHRTGFCLSVSDILVFSSLPLLLMRKLTVH